jgi:hypothetical protein
MTVRRITNSSFRFDGLKFKRDSVSLLFAKLYGHHETAAERHAWMTLGSTVRETFQELQTAASELASDSCDLPPLFGIEG